jgi:hypothetical protein
VFGISLLSSSAVSATGCAERRIGGVAGRSVGGRGLACGLRRLLGLEVGCFGATALVGVSCGGACGRVSRGGAPLFPGPVCQARALKGGHARTR